MQFSILMIIFSHFTVGLQAAEWVASFHNPEFPGKCAISANIILNEGVSIKDPMHECRQIVCGFNGSTAFQSCGYISGLTTNCYFGDYINTDLSYPLCCVREIICDNELTKSPKT